MSEKELAKKPKAHTSASERELDNVQEQFEKFDKEVKEMTFDRMNNLRPQVESESPLKMSQNQIANSKEFYLKPKKTISCRDVFNENYRSEYDHAKEYVRFSATNNEIIGENIEIWTKPFAGVPAQEWSVPVNKPVYGPRFLAEQIKRKFYHRLVMQESSTVGSDGAGKYYGTMAVDNTVQRLDCFPVSSSKSVFV